MNTKSKKEKAKKNRAKSSKKTKTTQKNQETVPPSKQMWLVKDNYSLRARIREMQRNLTEKEKRIKNLYQNIFHEREEVRALSNQVTESKKRDLSRLDLEDRIRKLQQNEAKLMLELTDQQEITKDAISNLYELQEESFREFERIEKYYQNLLEESLNKQQEAFENKIEVLKRENKSLSATIKNYQDTCDLQASNKTLSLVSEISTLKGTLKLKSLEIDKLRQENLELQSAMKNKEESHVIQITNLTNKIKQLEGNLYSSTHLLGSRNYGSPENSKRAYLAESELKGSYASSVLQSNEKSVQNKIENMSQKLHSMQEKLQKND